MSAFALHAEIEHCSWQLQEDVVIFRPGLNQLFVLNASACLIWRGTNDKLRVPEIASQLQQVYSLEREEALNTVNTTLAHWTDCHLLGDLPEPAPEPPGQFSKAVPERARAIQTNHYKIGKTFVTVHYHDRTMIGRVHEIFEHLQIHKAPDNHLQFDIDVFEGEFRLWHEARILDTSTDAATFEMACYRHLVQQAYQNSDSRMVFHAAGVVKNRSCMILAGAGGSGKSTLAAAMAMTGHAVIADDVLPVNPTSRTVSPLPLKINLKPASKPVLEARCTDRLETLHCGPLQHPVHFLPIPGFDKSISGSEYPASGIVFPRYRADSETDIQPLTPAQSLQRLLSSGSHMSSDCDFEVMDQLIQWISEIPAWSLTYSDMDDAIAFIEENLSGDRSNA